MGGQALAAQRAPAGRGGGVGAKPGRREALPALVGPPPSPVRTSMAVCTPDALAGFGGGRGSSATSHGGSRDLASLAATSRAALVASPTDDDPFGRCDVAPEAELAGSGDDLPLATVACIRPVAVSGSVEVRLLRRLKIGFSTADGEVHAAASETAPSPARTPAHQPMASCSSLSSRPSSGVSRVVSRRAPWLLGDFFTPCSEEAGRPSRRIIAVLGLTRGQLVFWLNELDGELAAEAEKGVVAPPCGGVQTVSLVAWEAQLRACRRTSVDEALSGSSATGTLTGDARRAPSVIAGRDFPTKLAISEFGALRRFSRDGLCFR